MGMLVLGLILFPGMHSLAGLVLWLPPAATRHGRLGRFFDLAAHAADRRASVRRMTGKETT